MPCSPKHHPDHKSDHKSDHKKECCKTADPAAKKAALDTTSHALTKACCHSLVAAPKEKECCSSSHDSKEAYSKEACCSKTKIQVKYNAGYPNNLFIRGSGGGLSWERGVPLKNISASEWVFESKGDCKQIEFKVLLNDLVYEDGPNHIVEKGKCLAYSPLFK